MVYYDDGKILIRDMQQSDVPVITQGERDQGWDADGDKYRMRLQHQAEGRSISLVGYPEIVDFGVLEPYRRQGVGSKLMDLAEEIAAQYAQVVYLGVGLHRGYGSAQRMYVKRGYLPDGTGVWYGDEACEQNGMYCNDDSLALYLSKKLR